jgi:hypothetical protein
MSLKDHQVSGLYVSLMLSYKERGNPLGEELPAVEGEDAAEERAFLGPRSGLLLLPQDRQVEVVGRAALLLTACNKLKVT